MKKYKYTFFLFLFLFSFNSFAELTLKEYADKHFDFDFDKMSKQELIYICLRCNALYTFHEMMGFANDKDKEFRKESGLLILESYKIIYPDKDFDFHWDLFNGDAEPHFQMYRNKSIKNFEETKKTYSDFHADDFAFCDMVFDPESGL